MIVGVDFSLTATGVCLIQDGEAECVTIGSRRESVWHEFPNRARGIALDIENWLALDGAEQPLIVIESPAFAAKSSSIDRMFGGWWVFVDTLMETCLFDPPLRVAPTQLKKFATGSGRAGKDEVMLAVSRRYPDVDVRDNNQTDALVLAAIGAAAVGEPFNQGLTKVQTEIVEAVRLGKGK